ncbi:hypothetical protein Cgig2_018084 [Carnegiea gigantea]|uniref:BUB1 N-terminal domain-containing protein n=1 Tax=Carnegiea gigantea TaxID=171969 RepID=A0A9Q1Q9S5_9CARY|nr:hypothetical protein Cgig2_018084 [Carnegiea gigantea]
MATSGTDMVDPETQFLMELRMKSKRRGIELDNNGVEADEEDDGDEGELEWDKYKENVRPLKRGRNVKILNDALKSNSLLSLKQSLLLTRRCIKWVQEAFPAGGDSSGLVVLYEHCVRTFWHDDRYTTDLRYLKVWLEYAENCADAEVIYRFLDANKIGQSHAAYYIAYALHMEAKYKIKTANDIFNQGLSINAQPLQKLEAAYRKFIARSMRRPKIITEEDSVDHIQPSRSFGTLLSRGENRRSQLEASDTAKKNTKGNGGQRIPLSVYKDTNVGRSSGYQADLSKVGSKQWDTLGTQKDRNKENKAIPAKWTSYKIPQRPSGRLGGAVIQGIEVFVDEEYSELHPSRDEARSTSNLQLKDRDEHDIRR